MKGIWSRRLPSPGIYDRAAKAPTYLMQHGKNHREVRPKQSNDSVHLQQHSKNGPLHKNEKDASKEWDNTFPFLSLNPQLHTYGTIFEWVKEPKTPHKAKNERHSTNITFHSNDQYPIKRMFPIANSAGSKRKMTPRVSRMHPVVIRMIPIFLLSLKNVSTTDSIN